MRLRMSSPRRNLVLFLLPVLCVHVGLSWLYQTYVVPEHRVSELDQHFLASDAPLDLLVVGDSHAMNGVQAKLLGPKALNIAVSGEHILKTYYRLPWLLDRSGRKVKTVVLPFDAHVFSERNTDRFEPEPVWGQYVDYVDLGLRKIEPVLYAKKWTKAFVAPYAGELHTLEQLVTAKRAFQNENSPNRFAARPDRAQRRPAEDAARDHLEGYNPLDEAMIWAFRSLIRELQRRDIQVVLVAYPVSFEYSRVVDAMGAREAVRERVLQPLLERKAIPFLDFETAFHDRPDWFYDGDHVNATGRLKLTKLLARKLVQDGYLPASYPLPEGRQPEYDWSRLESAIEALIEANDLPGAAMLVRRDGETLYEKHFGDYSADTEIMAGSASKWVSAAVIMRLVEDGVLDLDEPLSKWIPSFRVQDKRNITLRDALSHATGLMARHTVVNDYRISLASAVDHIATLPLEEPPGVAFRYGALGYHAAARAAEQATQRNWQDLYENILAKPLHLERTRYGHLGISENPGVAGNLITTAAEFANFLEMMLANGAFEGHQVLSADTVSTMEQGQTRGKPRRGHVPSRHQGTRHDLYGLGVWRDAVDSRGQLIMSSAPGKFGFTPWIDRGQNILGVFALEVDSEHPEDAIPEPANLQYLVCDILDRAERRPIVRTDVNPACRKGRRGGVTGPKP